MGVGALGVLGKKKVGSWQLGVLSTQTKIQRSTLRAEKYDEHIAAQRAA